MSDEYPLRKILLHWPGGSAIVDNDIEIPDAPNGEGAWVVREDAKPTDGFAGLQRITTRRVSIPQFRCETPWHLEEWIDRLLWQCIYGKELPGVDFQGWGDPSDARRELGAVPGGLYRMCAFPTNDSRGAWYEAMTLGQTSGREVEVVPSLGLWPPGFEGLGPNVIMGLPPPETLGICAKWGDGVYGLCMFPRMIKAVWVQS